MPDARPAGVRVTILIRKVSLPAASARFRCEGRAFAFGCDCKTTGEEKMSRWLATEEEVSGHRESLKSGLIGN